MRGARSKRALRRAYNAVIFRGRAGMAGIFASSARVESLGGIGIVCRGLSRRANL